MPKYTIVQSALAGFLCTLFLVVTAAADSPRQQVNIPPGDLSTALNALAKQSGTDLVYRPEQVKGLKTQGVSGNLSVEDALTKLLAGTPLTVNRDSTGAVLISTPKPHATAAPANPTTGSVTPAHSDLRVAQSQSSDTSANQAGPERVEESRKAKDEDLSEIVVTGTLLHHVAPITPVMTVTQADLINQGYTTAAEAIYDLPENFQGAGTSPASNTASAQIIGGNGTANNLNFASGINLRGLGGSATLVLLNGRRMAPTALGGSVDISQIPVSAIDRIEVMTDGASSLYGSDAVAGVVNIITKRDFSGLEVGGRSTGIAKGKTPNYGGDLVGGTSWNGGGLVGSFDYEKDNPLFARNRSFSETMPDPWALSPEQEAYHFYGSLHQDLTDRLTLSMDALATHRTYESQNNLFATQPPYMLSGHVNQYSLSPQLDFAISTDWKASLIGQWAREQDRNQLVFPGPSVALVPVSYQVAYIEPRVDGRLFDLPGGGVRLALGAQARQEKMDLTEPNGNNKLSRHVTSAYSELMIPIVGESNSMPFTRELRIDASARYDRYSDFGSTTNPKIGVSWTLIDGVQLHGSYSRSFQAPVLYYANTLGLSAYVAPYVNPQSPGGTSLYLAPAIVEPLQPEIAKTYDFGITLQPIDGLKIDASYFDINFTNQIIALGSELCISNAVCTLQDQAAMGSFFQRNPSLAEVNAILNNPAYPVNNYAGGNYNPAPYTASDITAIANLGYVNAASTRVRGVDLTPRYTGIDTPIGRFSADLNASFFLTYRQQLTITSTPFSIDNTAYNPLRFRAKANVGWRWQGFAANARINFANSYKNNGDPNCIGGCSISSWTTFDTGLSYAFVSDSASWLRDLRLAVIVTNLFDRDPPYVNVPFGNSNLGYDPVNASPFKRTVSVTFTKRVGRDRR